MEIFLPEWVAGIDFGPPRPSFEQLGPLRGCSTCTFGADGSAALFEGFLYGRESLVAELGLPTEAADAAVVAAAYERWDASFLDRLDGSYLVAVWDAAESRLLVGHDALGHHPVFFHRGRSGFWFSTNVLALAHCGEAPLRPNRVALALMLQLMRPPRGETFFEGVERLLPGRYLEVREGDRVREVIHWNPVPEEGKSYLDESAVLERFEPLLLRSLAHRMELSPHGIMLSGGLDSVCVAALAEEYTRERGSPPIRAYSGRHHPDDLPSYEEEMQDLVVERLGMLHYKSNELDWLGGKDLISSSLEEMAHFPCPTLIFWTGGYMGFARLAARAGHTRFLTGSGGDEWLSVDATYASDLIRSLSLGRLARFVRADSNGGGEPLMRVLRYQLWSWGLRPLLAASAERLLPGAIGRYLQSRDEAGTPDDLFPDGELSKAVREVMASRRMPLLDEHGRIVPSFYREGLRSVWRDSYLIHEREISYHAHRSSGALYMSPYHDRHLLEFLCRVPPYVLFRGSQYKGMVRELARKRLQGLGLGRQRKVYSREQASLHSALRNNLPRLWHDIGCQRLADLGLADPAKASARFDNLDNVRDHSLVKYFALLSAEVWLESNFDWSVREN